uniref:ATP-dependent RNA helicase n=1 Tax=Strongyloides stercoralis TaxID=6248 RepID=A0A0K0DSI4_STRER
MKNYYFFTSSDLNNNKNLNDLPNFGEFSKDAIDNIQDLEILMKYAFNVNWFKSKFQKFSILLIQQNHDCLFFCAPPGSGKTIILLSNIIADLDKVNIIILPTISLCFQYQQILDGAKIPYLTINSSNKKLTEKTNLIKLGLTSPNLFAKKINVILTTPESFINNNTNGLISSLYETNKINRVIVDEAHLIFQCGLTYRPDYLKLLKYLSKLTQLQIIFSSATLTKHAITKITNNISTNNYLTVRGCSFKNNILIFKIYKENLLDLSIYVDTCKRLNIIKKYITDTEQFKIICVVRRKESIPEIEDIYKKYKFQCVSLYSDLEMSVKQRNIEKFNNTTDIILLTTCGNLIGLDIALCTVLVHHAIPTNIDDYIQDIGRIRRDGNFGVSLFYATSTTVKSVKNLISEQTINLNKSEIYND